MLVQVKASYKLSEDFKKGPAKPKKAKKPAAAKPKKVCSPPHCTICIQKAHLGKSWRFHLPCESHRRAVYRQRLRTRLLLASCHLLNFVGSLCTGCTAGTAHCSLCGTTILLPARMSSLRARSAQGATPCHVAVTSPWRTGQDLAVAPDWG